MAKMTSSLTTWWSFSTPAPKSGSSIKTFLLKGGSDQGSNDSAEVPPTEPA